MQKQALISVSRSDVYCKADLRLSARADPDGICGRLCGAAAFTAQPPSAACAVLPDWSDRALRCGTSLSAFQPRRRMVRR